MWDSPHVGLISRGTHLMWDSSHVGLISCGAHLMWDSPQVGLQNHCYDLWEGLCECFIYSTEMEAS